MDAAGFKAPDDFAVALASHPDAEKAYRRLPPSHRRQYLQWIEEAKRPETRRRRIEKAVGMLSG